MAQFLEGETLNGLMGKFDRLLTAARQRQMFIPISCSGISAPPLPCRHDASTVGTDWSAVGRPGRSQGPSLAPDWTVRQCCKILLSQHQDFTYDNILRRSVPLFLVRRHQLADCLASQQLQQMRAN